MPVMRNCFRKSLPLLQSFLPLNSVFWIRKALLPPVTAHVSLHPHLLMVLRPVTAVKMEFMTVNVTVASQMRMHDRAGTAAKNNGFMDIPSMPFLPIIPPIMLTCLYIFRLVNANRHDSVPGVVAWLNFVNSALTFLSKTSFSIQPMTTIPPITCAVNGTSLHSLT